MLILFLLLLLVGPYFVLAFLSRWFPALKLSAGFRARVGLTLFFLFTALGHFIRTDQMAQMLPPSVPYRVELIHLTGIFEILGALGVWILRLRKIVGVLLIIMLIGILPSNIYAALARVEFGGHGNGPAYLLIRVPFQLLVIWWTYLSTLRQNDSHVNIDQ